MKAMKKYLSLALLVCLLLSNGAACLAEDTGIQIIGGPEVPAETVNLDDWKPGQTVDIQGFGELTFVSAEFVNRIENWSIDGIQSGNEADYLRLIVEILNTQTTDVDFYKLIDSGVCSFDDTYQFGTWKRQYMNMTSDDVYQQKDQSHAISPMYRGKYIIVVTLPNDVVKSKKPLSITFKIGDNEFTYHHRK